ncbi:DNA-3-methyladenine glycosylase [Methanolapillus millepedarum]|uniref:Putative 3-methyladenine DNA glycosylase n=1 Tax=Methanolapillus millepedarum TaxID=3028296 RepID=A0AA96V1X1_9EURY|nr:Putative 3-methyladenine DNA glycosylase [Methanosarcinaceae archaeon Ac7]
MPEKNKSETVKPKIKPGSKSTMVSKTEPKAESKSERLESGFYTRDVLTVAPELLGKFLVRKLPSGELLKYRITETEAYRGVEDTACHAKAGKTKRTAVMFEEGGRSYIYLCYGIHYLLNIVTGEREVPQAALIRGVDGFDGPAKLTKAMQIGKELNAIDLTESDEMWIEDDGFVPEFFTTKRIGINYATEPYKSIEWRYVLKNK